MINFVLFLRWLKENDAYEKFKENAIKLRYDNVKLMRTNSLHYETYLQVAFWWRRTPEGYYYWERLNCAWSKYCDGILRKKWKKR